MQTQLLNYQFMIKSFGKILSALPITLNIAIVTMIFSLILSFFVALARINKIKVVSKLATVYVSFIRGTPLLVQIYFYQNQTFLPLVWIYIYSTVDSQKDIRLQVFLTR